MSIRRTFLMLVPPLFLLLGAVNGAMLYTWEKAEAERGLERQAIAAAVTVAAFADTHDLAQVIADPVRAAGLRAAVRPVSGLSAIYMVDAAGRAWPVTGATPGERVTLSRPNGPMALPVSADESGHPFATGLAPTLGGRFVVARIDAAPLVAEVAELRRLVAAVVLTAGLLGLLLALVISRLIVRELARAGDMIEAIRIDAPATDAERFRIRETRDLALAVRLMRTSVAGRLARGRHELARRDRERDEGAAAVAYQATAFPPWTGEAAGVAVAVRLLGRAPPGSFYALRDEGDRAVLVLGRCGGETPAAALAHALAARAAFEATSDICLGDARTAFGLEASGLYAWSKRAPPARVVTLLDGGYGLAAEAYAARAEGLTPEQVLDDLEILLDAAGVAAAFGSVQGRDG
jgi:hypothetical protein